MNGRTAKQLRRMTREELIEQPAQRELVAHPRNSGVGVNNPDTHRGMYRALKKAWKGLKQRI